MKKYIVYILITLCFVCSVHAEFSLVHQPGMYDALQENGMQKTHTDYQVMYAMPGETVYLYRPERATFVGYVRWYCYDTDKAIPSWYTASDSPTGVAIPRIQSTWAKDTLASTLKFKAKNEYGWFGYVLATDGKATKGDENYVEIKYTMHKGDSIYRIACDQGIWNDYSPSTWNNDVEMTEPTLSKRIIFEIRPAKWMADSLELCKSTAKSPNDSCYLEEHKLIAPVGRQLYVGPNHMYHTKRISFTQYTYQARSNYYFYDNDSILTPAGNDNLKWKWYKNGKLDKTIVSGDNGAQFAKMSSDVPGTFVYTMKYEYAEDYSVNVARFTITYINADEVGPSLNIPAPSKNMEKIYEENFNYDSPGTTDFKFWGGYFDVDESTYGYYTQNISWNKRQSKSEQKKVTWSEYAITNRKQVWVDSGTAPQVYQHVTGKGNEANNAKEGYMIYCDGSQQPGQVFNLKIHTDLCPGSTMYFYAWLCDASSTGSGKSAPNMDFIVTGIDDSGEEHPLTTFTTGEFGINAGIRDGMDRGIWYQIRFPVKFTAETTYPTYRLRITNKSTSSDGNDFAIDDIHIYVEKPPVMPIQASTSDCIDKAVDSIRSYIRVDYKEISNYSGEPLYYQWRENDKVVHSTYYNVDSASTTFGKINILPDANITPADTCLDILSFDRKFRKTKIPVVRYIEEPEGSGRYVMYIAMPMEVRINHEYTSFVSLSPSTLGDRSGCGTFADMLVAGGTRITINDEITFGDSVVTVCGHRTYTLNIVLTKIIQDETQGELRIDTTHCRADWLIGDSVYVNSHPEIYKYSFEDIEEWLGFYHQHVPSAKPIIDFLTNHGLLVLDTASIVMNPGVSLSYTAFPIDGSAGDKKVCTSPRFLHINPAEPASNMMEVGDSTEVLPEELLSQPRIVRISNAKKNDGSFDLPLYIKGDTTERYIIDSVHIISSTNPNWFPIRLSADHPIMAAKDTVLLSSDSLPLLEAGYDYTFHVAFKGESDEDKCDRGYTYFTLRIIPDVVTWYGDKWNVDANWDYFIPMAETNVILTDTDYVVSFNDESLAKFDINYTESECNNIYFPDTASMYGQELITIHGKAFIDIRVYPWKWTLTSVPIKGIVSGDFFAKTDENPDAFSVASIQQTPGTEAVDRTRWKLYRKVFDVSTNKWQISTNALNDTIKQGATDMIGVDCANEGDTVFIRLPKQDIVYHYYSANTWVNDNVPVIRNEDYGKPIWNGDKVIQLPQVYNSVYLFGNPTFGYIDITTLIEDNTDKFTGRYYFEKRGSDRIPKTIDDFNGNVYEEAYHKLLPPYRGILLEGTTASDSITINLTKDNINPAGSAPKRRAHTTDNNVATQLDYVDVKDSIRIYDIMGRYVGGDFGKLTNGLYIIYGQKTHKVFITR